MVVQRGLTGVMLLVLCGTIVACPTEDDGDENGGVTDTDGTPDLGSDPTVRPDAGDTGGDIPVGPTDEDLTITYLSHTRVPDTPDDEFWQLWVTDEDCTWEGCDATEVTGGALSCEVECALAPELDFVVWTEPGTANLKVAPVDTSFQVSTESRVVSTDVQGWELGPDSIVYNRNGTVYAQPYWGGDEVQIIEVSAEGGLPGGFHYAPQIDRVIANIPTSLSSADLVEVSVTNPTEQRTLYHFVSDIENYPGSFYQGHMDLSASPDGQFVAVFTEAWDMAEPCTPGGSTCSNDEYECSELNPDNPRCKGEQLVLHIINRSDAHLLTTPDNPQGCNSNADCGAYHECDTDAYHESAAGVCVPGHRVLGPYGRYSCMTTGSGPYLDPGEYNGVTGDPMWRSDGRIVFVGSNNCAGQNIDVTDMVVIDVSLQSIEVIIDNPGEGHGGDDCVDPVEETYTPEGCIIEISRTAMSPSGNTVAFIGSSVRSYTDTEVWRIDAFGRGGKQYVTHDMFNEILRIDVHSPLN